MRIECGKGLIAVHSGQLDGVPCLAIGNNGEGEIGAEVGADGYMSESVELLTVSFTSAKSVEVWIEKLNEVKKMLRGEKPLPVGAIEPAQTEG